MEITVAYLNATVLQEVMIFTCLHFPLEKRAEDMTLKSGEMQCYPSYTVCVPQGTTSLKKKLKAEKLLFAAIILNLKKFIKVSSFRLCV